MQKYEELLKISKEIEDEERLINEDIAKIINENKRVENIAVHSELVFADIEKKFAEATKLERRDFAFLFLAVALQCLRQYFLTSFEERSPHDESEKEAKKKEKEIFNNRFRDVDDVDESIRYKATLGDIITKGVPYDVQFGSGDFELGLGGNEHRYKTLGHDPLLGWVFGTANIMTSTLTSWQLKSYHVKPAPMANGWVKAKIVQNADTAKMFEKVKNRIKDEPEILGAALIKQRLHIKSDEYSKAGLPVPVIMTLSPEVAMNLANYGIDAGNLKTVGKQMTYSILINTLIAMIHGMFYNKETCGPLDLYKVKTRKILLYSNVIASASNLIVVAVESAIKQQPDLHHLDIGGILVTLYRIATDTKFINNVKAEFIYNDFNRLVHGEEYNFNLD